jgi:hypothetical protein
VGLRREGFTLARDEDQTAAAREQLAGYFAGERRSPRPAGSAGVLGLTGGRVGGVLAHPVRRDPHLRPDGRPRIEDAWSVSRPGRTTTREEERIDVKITNAIVAREVTREVTRLLGIAVGEDRQLLELRIPTGLQQSQTARTRYALMRFPIKGSGNIEVFDSLEEAADAWEKITGERPAAAVDLGR